MSLLKWKSGVVLMLIGNLFSMACGSFSASGGPAANAVTITSDDVGLRVEIGGELFTEYLTDGQTKPILYPVIGPHGIPMTRNFPMKEGVPGESSDHPHHRSLWFTHGDVNGIDFWAEGPGKGHIVQIEPADVDISDNQGQIITRNRWQTEGGDEVCMDRRKLTFQALPGGKAIDLSITISATKGDLTFGDTKEGSMGIRTCPALRLVNDPGQGVTTANGQAVNSEGVTGAAIWGKRAKWVDYWGTVEGQTVGVAIFDNPANPRHPTTWHAREYGLIAANPFGLHDFEGKPAGAGNMVIPSGESVTFAYRFFFHDGDTKAAQVSRRYAEYCQEQ